MRKRSAQVCKAVGVRMEARQGRDWRAPSRLGARQPSAKRHALNWRIRRLDASSSRSGHTPQPSVADCQITVDPSSSSHYPTRRTFVLHAVFPMTNTAHIPEDSPYDLGVPTELESYQNQCLMLLDELHEAWADIRRLKGDARTLVAMNDALRAELNALRAAQLRSN